MTGYLFADCRFDLSDPGAGRSAYESGHIPGAVFFDLDTDLSDRSIPPEQGGRHPLPDARAFARRAGELGVAAGRLVVAYDQGMAGGSARLAWMLHHPRHHDRGEDAENHHDDENLYQCEAVRSGWRVGDPHDPALYCQLPAPIIAKHEHRTRSQPQRRPENARPRRGLASMYADARP